MSHEIMIYPRKVTFNLDRSKLWQHMFFLCQQNGSVQLILSNNFFTKLITYFLCLFSGDTTLQFQIYSWHNFNKYSETFCHSFKVIKDIFCIKYLIFTFSSSFLSQCPVFMCSVPRLLMKIDLPGKFELSSHFLLNLTSILYFDFNVHFLVNYQVFGI